MHTANALPSTPCVEIIAAPTAPKHQRADKILAGTARLLARRRPGESFTDAQIAAECGVTRRAITFIVRRAQTTFLRRLHAMSPQLIAELLGGEEQTRRMFAKLNTDPYRTGKRSHWTEEQAEEVARRRKAERADSARGLCGVTMWEVSQRVARRRTTDGAVAPCDNFSSTQIGRTKRDAVRCLERQHATELLQRSGGVIRIVE